jgi:hypothetical protein
MKFLDGRVQIKQLIDRNFWSKGQIDEFLTRSLSAMLDSVLATGVFDQDSLHRQGTVILRHISEAHDENASEGKVEFLDADTIKLWPPSGLQQLKETSYTLSRVAGSSPKQGTALKLPAEVQRVVATWETQARGMGTIQMDLLPDGTMYYKLGLGQASRAQWNYKMMDGRTVLIETGPSDDKMGIARVKFLTDDKMVMSEEDDTNAMTFTRVEGLIE